MTEIDSDRWTKISAKKKEINNLVLDEYEYSSKFKELGDVYPTSRLEGHKKKTGIKIVAPHKLLTRTPVLLAQRKAGNNLQKLKTEIRQILYLLYQRNKIAETFYNHSIKSLQQYE